jgi:hypothetical protein
VSKVINKIKKLININKAMKIWSRRILKGKKIAQTKQFYQRKWMIANMSNYKSVDITKRRKCNKALQIRFTNHSQRQALKSKKYKLTDSFTQTMRKWITNKNSIQQTKLLRKIKIPKNDHLSLKIMEIRTNK